MAIDERDRLEIINLIEGRVEPVRIQRIEFEELKSAVRDLQVEVAHLAENVAEQGRQIALLCRQVAELAQAQRRSEERMEKGFAEFRRALAEQGMRIEEQGKRIDTLADRMEKGFADLRQEMAAGAAELRREMAAGAAELRGELAAGLSELRREMAERDERMERGFAALHQEIGALTDAYGVDLEDVACFIVPWFLEHEEGWTVGPLENAYLRLDGEEIEVDLLGEARRGDEIRTVVAEAKSRVHLGEIDALIRRNRRIAAARGGSFLWVLFPRRIHPKALDRARAEGILVIPWDYQYARR